MMLKIIALNHGNAQKLPRIGCAENGELHTKLIR